MRDLLNYSLRVNDERTKAIKTILVILAIIFVSNFFLYAFDKVAWMTVTSGIIGIFEKILIIIALGFLILLVILQVESMVKGARFKRIFGFYPPITKGGKESTRLTICTFLGKLASVLDSHFKEEKANTDLLQKGNPLTPGRVQEIEKKLQSQKITIKKLKREFYAKRDIAKKIGYNIPTDIEDFIEFNLKLK